MHELALAEGILAVAQDAADGENISLVRVHVRSLQHVTQESLQFAFELIARDTNVEAGTIVVDQVAARYRCKQCAGEGEIQMPHFHCLSCASGSSRSFQAKKFLLTLWN